MHKKAQWCIKSITRMLEIMHLQFLSFPSGGPNTSPVIPAELLLGLHWEDEPRVVPTPTFPHAETFVCSCQIQEAARSSAIQDKYWTNWLCDEQPKVSWTKKTSLGYNCCVRTYNIYVIIRLLLEISKHPSIYFLSPLILHLESQAEAYPICQWEKVGYTLHKSSVRHRHLHCWPQLK